MKRTIQLYDSRHDEMSLDEVEWNEIWNRFMDNGKSMPSEFKIGDVVRLKSNGRKMTMLAIYNDGKTDQPMVWCKWFHGSAGQRKLKEEGFPPDAMERLDRPSPPASAEPAKAS